MKKRIISLALLTVILVASAVGCKKENTNEEEITLNIKAAAVPMGAVVDPEVKDVYTFLDKAAKAFSEQYEVDNVTFNVSQFELAREYNEITDCFDTEYAVDILYEDYFNMSTYIYTGRVVPLDDIITEEIRNDIYGSFWESSQKQGKTYMMPFLSFQNVLCYNKDLFRDAGLDKFISDKDEVQTWTMEEWETILKTLKENLPDTSYPMMMYAASEDGDKYIMTLLQSFGNPLFDDSGYFNLNTPKGNDALQWIRKCDKKGYFPPNSESLVMLDNYSLFTNGQLAIYMVNASLKPQFEDAGLDIGFVNFPSIDNAGYYTDVTSGFEVFDNGDEDKIKIAKDFVKYIYEGEWLDYSAESIPVSKRVSEKYADDLKFIEKYINNNGTPVNFPSDNPNWRGVRDVFYIHIQDLMYGEKSVETIAEELDSDCNAAIKEGYKNISFHE